MNTPKSFVARAYNSFVVSPYRPIIIKTSKEKKLKNEIDYYEAIPERLKSYFPTIFNAGLSEDGEYFLDMEYYSYSNLGQYLIGDKTLTREQWVSVAQALAAILDDFSDSRTLGTSSRLADVLDTADLEAMYFTKTEDEYKKLIQNFPTFGEIAKCPTVVVNDKAYSNFEIIWPEIKTKFHDLLIEENKVPCVIHGDCCFSNILLGISDGRPMPVIKFIDPRGFFGSRLVFGDRYYDFAKLMHSTDVGYEHFIYDRFNITKKTGLVSDFELKVEDAGDTKKMVHEIFSKNLFSRYNSLKIKLIQGLIFIGMCARHYDSLDRQLAMYLSGVRLLNEVLEEEKCHSNSQ